ncbi:hypothetical protein P7K49_024842 [Saguinus oedipus]|uniref:Uncharacterized protein n=1 Tax=Saguinus oedipus TaxID=9490 RepID=A0ABQ9UFG2_SAGOE|nr:hypothetical protein P7K49_024842 [Saguinus oedipus]
MADSQPRCGSGQGPAPRGTQWLTPSPAAAEGRDQHAHPQVYMKTLPGLLPAPTPGPPRPWAVDAGLQRTPQRQGGGRREREVTGTGLSSPPFQQQRAPVPTPLPDPGSSGYTATKGSEGTCPTPGCLAVPEPTWSSGSCTASPRGRAGWSPWYWRAGGRRKGLDQGLLSTLRPAPPALTTSDRSPDSDFQQLPTPVPHFASTGTDGHRRHNRGWNPDAAANQRAPAAQRTSPVPRGGVKGGGWRAMEAVARGCLEGGVGCLSGVKL